MIPMNNRLRGESEESTDIKPYQDGPVIRQILDQTSKQAKVHPDAG